MAVWADEAAAKAGIPLTERHPWLTVNIANEEWRWKDWVTDWDLVIKTSWGSGAASLIRKYEVTANFEAWEIITVTTGDGSVSGESTPSGDVVNTLGVNAAEFNDNNQRNIRVIWLWTLTKWKQVVWDSSNSFHFTFVLSVWDWFEVIVEEWN